MAIQIPAPVPSDSEKVVNLLQNAALFGRIGDTEEAVNWLRQAAECAGECGDDARTLVLARTAAELSTASGRASENGANGRSGVHERRLPVPPPRSRPPVTNDSTELPASSQLEMSSPATAAEDEVAATDEPVLLLKRVAPVSKAPSKAPDAAAARAVEAAAPEDKSPESKPPDSRATLSPPPLPRVRANGSRPPPASTRPSPTSRPAPLSSRSHAPASSASRPPLSRAPQSARSAPVSRGPAAPAPSTRSHTPASPSAAPIAVVQSLRQGARVSVERSSSDPGLLLVRVLEEGRAPKAGCTEALLVSLEAGAGPFLVSERTE